TSALLDGFPVFDFLANPVIAVLFEVLSQFCASRLNNSSTHHYMNIVRIDIVEDPLVMSNYQNTQVGSTECIHAIRYNSQCINIEPGIRFIQNGKPWLQHCHL